MKRKLFWIIYFAVAILMIAVAALVIPHYIVLNLYSLFPIGYFLFASLFAWLSSDHTYKLRINSRNFSRIFYRIKYDRQLGLSENDEPGAGKIISEFDAETNLFYHCTCQAMLLLLPFLIAFIFFFSTTAKIICGFSILIPLVWGFSNAGLASYRAEKARKMEIARARKEQERREELGKWK